MVAESVWLEQGLAPQVVLNPGALQAGRQMQRAKLLLQQPMVQHTHGLLTIQQLVLTPQLQGLTMLLQMHLGSSAMLLQVLLLPHQRAAAL
jgi:hypothetical protein